MHLVTFLAAFLTWFGTPAGAGHVLPVAPVPGMPGASGTGPQMMPRAKSAIPDTGMSGSLNGLPQLDFGDVAVGSQLLVVDTLYNPTDRTLRLQLSVANDQNGAFEVVPALTSIILGPNDSVPFLRIFQPPFVGGFIATLRVYEPATGGVAEWELVGNGTPAPGVSELDVEPDNLDFGDAQVRSPRTRKARLENHGDKPLYLTGRFKQGNGIFDVANGVYDFLVQPHDHIDVNMIFVPSFVAEYVDRFEFFDASVDTAVAMPLGWIDLHGRGVRSDLLAPDSVEIKLDRPDSASVPVVVQNVCGRTVRLNYLELADTAAGFTIRSVSSSTGILPPDSSMVIWVQYRDSLPRRRTTELNISYDSYPEKNMEVKLIGSMQGSIVISKLQVDFGTADTCKLDSFVVSNYTGSSISFDWRDILPNGAQASDSAFDIVRPSAGQTLSDRSSMVVVIRYCPHGRDTSRATWIGKFTVFGSTQSIPVALFGLGLGEGSTRIWLDTNLDARAGESARLSLRISGDMSTAAWDSMTISFNPTSLVFSSATLASGEHVAARYLSDTSVAFVRTSGTGLARDGRLIDLNFVGLTTGQPMNDVKLRRLYTHGIGSARVDSAGLVVLSGCEIGRDFGLVRKGAIRAVAVDPYSRMATIRYLLPEGADAQITLVDVSGQRVRLGSLAPGNGNEQGAQLDLSGLPPGFYIVEITVGQDRTTASFIITR